jgi:hypothetical protein
MPSAQGGDNFSVYIPAVLNRPAINPPKGRLRKVINLETHSSVYIEQNVFWQETSGGAKRKTKVPSNK